ncbi:AI-2E family transporter [Jatrophihabitans sp.]|uniref:AI-2E family transporter n=1 Tax=Jatrophihabitans sp. TaxID=1932789 RepID=UPI0030C68F1A|nr:putative PurR-regulated permease PerM [Jatrophihabitans sp.]
MTSTPTGENPPAGAIADATDALADAADDMAAAADGMADAADDLADATASEARRRRRRGSLFDHVPEGDSDNPYGEPGPPVSRSAPFYRGFWAATGVILAVLLASAVDEASSVLLLVLIAGFLAVGLNPVVEFLIGRGWRRGWAVLVVAVSLLAVITLIVVVLIGVLRNQILSFVDDAPHLLKDLLKHKSIAHLNAKYHVITNLEKKLENPNFAEDTFGGVFNVGLSVFKGLGDTVVVFVLTLYFLSALPQLKHGIYSLAPASRRARVGKLGDEILRRVGRFVIGAFLVALLAGTVSAIFLVIVGLGQYALPLAVMVAVLDLVPLVGSLLGASIVSVVGLANSLPIGIACVAFYLVYETLEGYVIYPRVMRSSVDVPEYVTIVAVLLGGAVGGVIGALLALPIAAAGLLLVREVWVRRQDAM